MTLDFPAEDTGDTAGRAVLRNDGSTSIRFGDRDSLAAVANRDGEQVSVTTSPADVPASRTLGPGESFTFKVRLSRVRCGSGPAEEIPPGQYTAQLTVLLDDGRQIVSNARATRVA